MSCLGGWNEILCSRCRIKIKYMFIISFVKSRRMRWRGMWHAWERREKSTRSWWESPKERDYLEDQGVGGKMGSECILGGLAWGV
jgi:hypothetical protein